MAYGPTSPLGGSRIFYSSSILWDSDLSTIRVKWILLNLTLGSRDHFHPESTLLQMIASWIRRSWRYSLMFSRGFVPVAFAIPYHRNIPMDKYIHLLLLLLFPVDLVITRYLEILSVVPRILWAYCLAVLCHLNTPMDNSRTHRVSAHPPVVHVFHNGLQNTIRSSKNP